MDNKEIILKDIETRLRLLRNRIDDDILEQEFCTLQKLLNTISQTITDQAAEVAELREWKKNVFGACEATGIINEMQPTWGGDIRGWGAVFEWINFLGRQRGKALQSSTLPNTNQATEKVDGWQPIESAPKGGGAELVTDPNWIDPPLILLRFPCGSVSAARWDWYYAEGGRGCKSGVAWIEPTSAEELIEHYGIPTHWQALPPVKEGDK